MDKMIMESNENKQVSSVKEQCNNLVAWYDETLNAALWLSLKNIFPKDAATLLYGINPHEDHNPLTYSTDETTLPDFKNLLLVFEDEAQSNGKNRTLQQWREIACARNLKFHSWINEYLHARGEVSEPTKLLDENPWNVVDPRDPLAKQPWYTPARHFARQLVKNDSTLSLKREILARKTSQLLFNAGIFGRTKDKALDAGTILKAFTKIKFS